jgi:aspartyl-tRNA(Asn)/glutamyl-tRNA(Gln) amidotransferase subunit C
MSLTRAEVEHIANLARLELSAEELEHFREQLSAILDYAARLQALDTSRVGPIAGMVLGEAPLRADEPAASLLPADLLRGAPQVEDQQFRVPPVLE